MKNLIAVVLIAISFTGFGQKQPKKAEITIKTDVQCGDCEDRIEGKFNYTKGIKFSEVNVEEDIVFVKYDPRKISEKEILIMLTELGYDANDMKATEEARKGLPLCCQPGGHE